MLIQHSCDGTKANKYSARIRRIGSNSTNIETRLENEGRNYKNTLTECFMKIIINVLRFNLKANKLETEAKAKAERKTRGEAGALLLIHKK